VAAVLDDPVICLCRGVTEDQICAAIEAGARTVEEVRHACGANTGCGGCQDEIWELIEDAR
jgi:bacterioferritin-associated ferredoxin